MRNVEDIAKDLVHFRMKLQNASMMNVAGLSEEGHVKLAIQNAETLAVIRACEMEMNEYIQADAERRLILLRGSVKTKDVDEEEYTKVKLSKRGEN